MNNEFENYFATVKLDNEQKFQLLSSSQLYGTNFSIFGKFTLSDIDTDKSCSITHLELKIFNYKGLLNLGFSKLDGHKTHLCIKEENGVKFVQISFTLRAVVGGIPKNEGDQSEVAYEDVVALADPLRVEKPIFLRTERTLVPISGDIDQGPVTNGVFDSEFYYRDGDKYGRRILRDIDEDASPVPIEKISNEYFPSTGPGLTCRRASFHFLINEG